MPNLTPAIGVVHIQSAQKLDPKKTGLAQSTPSTFTFLRPVLYHFALSTVVSGPILYLLHPVPSHKRGSFELDNRHTIKSNGTDIHALRDKEMRKAIVQR